MNDWLFLLLAGLFEIGFTTSMKLSEGFSRGVFSGLFVLCAIFSFGCLSLATRTIPLGTAYAVWTGIGAAGTAFVGMVFFGDPTQLARVFFLCLIIAGVIGMKLVSG